MNVTNADIASVMHHLCFTPVTEVAPPQGTVIIVKKADGTRCQVEIRNGRAYRWMYTPTHEVFCEEPEIVSWRGCGGFDF